METITSMIFCIRYINRHRFCVSTNQETKSLVITIQKKVIDIRSLITLYLHFLTIHQNNHYKTSINNATIKSQLYWKITTYDMRNYRDKKKTRHHSHHRKDKFSITLQPKPGGSAVPRKLAEFLKLTL